jgi:hypothetical protein
LSTSIHCKKHSHHWSPSIISYAYKHFQIEFRSIGFSIQFFKCAAWSSSLLPNFDTPSHFNTPSKGILTHCHIFTIIDFLVFFYSFFLQVFGCLLGPRSIDSPKRPLAHKQAFLSITFGGNGLIPTLGYPLLTLCPKQWTHEDPWCNSWHFCYHCIRWWLPCKTRTTTCPSLNHIQFLPSVNQHCAH